MSPRIEEVMGFTQSEWLEDPVRWYDHIHPEDQERWSLEAAEMFLTGKPLRSAYRVLAPRRPRRLVPVRGKDGASRRRAPLVHPRGGLRHHGAQAKPKPALESERNLRLGGARHRRCAGGGAEPVGRHRPLQPRVRADISGYSFPEVRGRYFWDLFPVADEARGMRELLQGLHARPAARLRERLDGAGRLPAPDRVVEHHPARHRDRARARHHHRASTSPNGSGWRRRCSRSAAGSSAASGRICTTAWASI